MQAPACSHQDSKHWKCQHITGSYLGEASRHGRCVILHGWDEATLTARRWCNNKRIIPSSNRDSKVAEWGEIFPKLSSRAFFVLAVDSASSLKKYPFLVKSSGKEPAAKLWTCAWQAQTSDIMDVPDWAFAWFPTGKQNGCVVYLNGIGIYRLEITL